MSGPPQSKSETIASTLKIIFMGTPALAARVLDRLVGAHDARFRVVAVVTRPDEARGRGLTPASSEVATVASRHQIPTLKPERIKTPDFLERLKSYEPDLLVVAAYGRILPQSILDAPRIMPLNARPPDSSSRISASLNPSVASSSMRCDDSDFFRRS